MEVDGNRAELPNASLQQIAGIDKHNLLIRRLCAVPRVETNEEFKLEVPDYQRISGGAKFSHLLPILEGMLEKAIMVVVGYVILCASAASQEQPRILRGGGHLLGETVEDFFSEAFAGEMQQACERKDWKAVKQLANNGLRAKDVCAGEKLAKRQAIGGARLEFSGPGDPESMRTDTFTLDGGHLVKIHMFYTAPSANVEGNHPKSFNELFAGLQEAYGPPSKRYSEPVFNVYGIKTEAYRALWMGDHDVISLIEEVGKQMGDDGGTEVIAETIAEYNRAAKTPKAANPLQ